VKMCWKDEDALSSVSTGGTDNARFTQDGNIRTPENAIALFSIRIHMPFKLNLYPFRAYISTLDSPP
jgi:hypothetical protein